MSFNWISHKQVVAVSTEFMWSRKETMWWVFIYIYIHESKAIQFRIKMAI
jgi:hypothetical protein